MQSPPKRSTRRLSEAARHVVIPAGIVTTEWPKVEKRCNEWGDHFDFWQQGMGRAILGKRADLTFAATVGGITLSIPRQVAKTFIVGRIVFALCSLYPGLRVLWTAHHGKTITNTFRSLAGLARRKKVAPHIAPNGIHQGVNDQEIHFANGSIIIFGSRAQGFGRGFDEIDVEVFDECQSLTNRALEDMVAAAAQSRHLPGGALLFYMGTPPRREDPGEVFIDRRADALALKGGSPDFGPAVAAGDAVYIECSADVDVGMPGGPSLDDERQWLLANPSYPDRTPHVSMLRLRKNLKSDDSWRREGLGVWDKVAGASRFITESDWTATETDTTPPDGIRSIGVAFSQDGSRVSVAGAVKHPGGIHVELIDTFSGSTELGVSALADWLAARSVGLAEVHICGPDAPVLVGALADRKVPSKQIHQMTTGEYFAACAMAVDSVREGVKTPGVFTHPKAGEGDALDGSVAVCDRKVRATGMWGWVATTADGDETPTEAMSVALRAAKTTKRRPGRTVRGRVL